MPAADFDQPPSADLTDLALFAEGFPHEVFARLRAAGPVRWHPPTEHTPGGEGFWVVSGHHACALAARDPRTYSSSHGGPRTAGGGTLIEDLPVGWAARGVLLNMSDDPRHQHIRKLISPPVGPRALAVLEAELADRAATVVRGAVERGECDFLLDVAAELPLQAISTLLGVPQADRHMLFGWAETTLDLTDHDLGGTSDAVRQAQARMHAYSADLLARKRAAPSDDLLSLAAAGVPEQLTELEAQMFFSLLIAAGSETTRNAIALGMQALIDRPDVWQELRADRGLLPGAIEEILRYTSVTTYNRRTATRDTELAGVPIAAGDKVTLWWAAANRDPAVFADPDGFDIRRNPNPHLSFGQGVHFCLGAALARTEMRLVFGELLDRVDRIENTAPLDRTRSNKHAGVRRMPVRLMANPGLGILRT